MSDSTLIPTKFRPVTKSNSGGLGNTIGLFVGTGGDLIVTGEDDVQATLKVTSGSTVSGKFKTVRTESTAADIVALYA